MLALGALCFSVVGVGAAVVLYSDLPRRALASVASDRFGRGVAYETLEFRLVPPQLVASAAILEAGDPSAPPLLQARLARWTLTARGLFHAVAPFGELELEDVRWTPAPGAELGFAHVRLRTDSSAAGGGVVVDLEGSSTEGGHVHCTGTVAAGGRYDLTLQLEGIDVAPLRALVPSLERFEGSLSGHVQAQGDTTRQRQLRAELQFVGARLRSRKLELSGDFVVRLELEDPIDKERARGSFEVDALAATLEYAGAYRKAAGQPAQLTGRIERDADGDFALTESHLQVGGSSR